MASEAPVPEPAEAADLRDATNRVDTRLLPYHLTNIKVWNRFMTLQPGEICNIEALEDAIQKVSGQKARLSGLKTALDTLPPQIRLEFLTMTLRAMVTLGLQAPSLFPAGLPPLLAGKSAKLVLSRKQVACLLTHAFFNTFPHPQGHHPFTFLHLLSDCAEKTKSLLHYFMAAVHDASGNIVLTRVHRRDVPDWGSVTQPLMPLYAQADGLIEADAGHLQADFANASIGGLSLSAAIAQEEIRFAISTECFVTMLVCEDMNDYEAVLISGCAQFSTYEGYFDFRCTGPYVDTAPIDADGVRQVHIIAFDALMGAGQAQFQQQLVDRELNKAWIAFSATAAQLPLSTSNWGCGMFGGDKQLKALIQWMAASLAGRDTRYHTFRDEPLARQLRELVSVVQEHHVSIADLYRTTIAFAHDTERVHRQVIPFVLAKLRSPAQ